MRGRCLANQFRRLLYRGCIVGQKKVDHLVRAPRLLVAACIGALTIWATYFFSFGPMPGGGPSLPAPEFFDGIRTALRHNSEGHPSYLLGMHGTTGWWYYFPVALAVKTPIAFLLLLIPGVWLCVKRPARVGPLLPIA